MDEKQPLKILIVAPEVSPFVRTGGLADVVGELPPALRALGHDVRVAIPRYGLIKTDSFQSVIADIPVPFDSSALQAQVSEHASVWQGLLGSNVPVYFIESARFFDREGLYMYPDDAERFIFFCRAVLEMLPRLGWQPDIIHTNDWPTAIIPNWLKTIYASSPFFQRTASVYTIHNLAYQGIFGQRVLEIAGLANYGFIVHPEVATDVNEAFDFMARGILYADAISTMSERYAREIQTREFGEKLDPILRMRAARLRGIHNGIDYAHNDPATDPVLARNFDAEGLAARADNKRALLEQAGLDAHADLPLVAMISRLNDSKGLDIVENAIDHILELGVQFILMGSGEAHYRQVFTELQEKYPKQVKVHLAFDGALMHRIVAASDIILMPSRIEPSGTTQLLAMHYGCVPVVHATGGLADSVQDFDPRTGEGTGFKFEKYDRWALYAAVVRALECYRRPAEWRALQKRGMNEDVSWKRAANQYVELYRFALGKKLEVVEREARLAREIQRTAEIMAALPERLGRLPDLAYNLWWSWHDDALDLFERIDRDTWETSNHNPVKMVRELQPERMEHLARDEDFVKHYDRVIAAFDKYMRGSETWFETTYPYVADRTIAYFSAEFGLHESLPMYSGGLGILSGDHVKESSDLGLPLVGIGFLYPQGYFRQELDQDGNQIAIYDKLNFAEVPAVAAQDADGNEIVVGVEMPGRTVYAKVWQIQVGRTQLYLMDTDVEANADNDRILSARLYGGDHETRIMQEIMLGIGGVRVLRKLGLNPSGYHMNEGHSTFLVLELIRELVAQGYSFDAALREVRSRAIFTTHTPVSAGNDAFAPELMDKFFGNYYPQLGTSREKIFDIARQDGLFSMTVLGLRGSNQTNGVSQLHSQISRNMWHFVWPDRDIKDVPIGSITNGVHTATWLHPELGDLFTEILGENWYARLDDPTLWTKLDAASDASLWQIHQSAKEKLIAFVRLRAVQRLARLKGSASEIEAAQKILDPNVLTLGFARRFATYKRATLMFRDTERLKRILNAEGRPVQIIFSGKAHPADEPGKDLIRQVIRYSKEPGFEGRIVFLEDYGIDDARVLVRGADVWLNNPRRPMEASGTSGQKAGLNGVLNTSVLDGWWVEGNNGCNGWVIGTASRVYDSTEAQDEADALSLYDTLENQIVPLYYQRDGDGLPHGWLAKSKESIRTIAPTFSTRRMVKEYVKEYLKAIIPERIDVSA